MRIGSRSVLGSVRALPGKGCMELLLTADGLAAECNPNLSCFR